MKKFKFNKISMAILAIVFTFGLGGIIATATLAPGALNLSTTANFAVLSGSGVVDTTPSNIIGDVGSSPITGAAIGIPSGEVTGTIYSTDGAGTGDVMNVGLLISAKNDLSTAYNSVGVALPDIGTDLATQIITAGTYHAASGTFGITGGGTLTLDGQNDPNSVFIFKTDSTLVTSGTSKVVLINGAQACNVFWQVGSSATLGSNSTFIGTVMAVSSITDNSGSTVLGRLLADADNDGTGAVTLNNTTVTVPACAPSLSLNKTVDNTGGGTALATAWTLTATGASGAPTNLSGTTPVDSSVVFSGATFKADTYTLAETGGPSDYTASTYSCVTNGGGAVIGNSITLASDDDATCTITNTYVIPTPIVPAPVQSSHSGGSGGSTHYGCRDTSALNFEDFAASNPALCIYANSTVITTTNSSSTVGQVLGVSTYNSPSFPNTGYGQEGKVTTENLFIVLGVSFLGLLSLVLAFRRGEV